MKPNHHSDPLDQKIDALLASRPLKPSDDFAERVLAEAENSQQNSKRQPGQLLKFALPLAAAIALTFSLLQLRPESNNHSIGASTTTASKRLSAAEAQEIFILEESLANIATIGTSNLGTQNLLSTLDALYLEI